LPVGEAATLDVSIICPFYNEEEIIGNAIEALLRRLERLPVTWELIVVNDGSTDDSGRIAGEIAKRNGKLRVLDYRFNRGRGHALRVGIAQARGKVIITTEIDLSWGEDIVERLYQAMQEHPDVDIVIASPHLPGGGYKNVPAKRVFFSRFGNWVIRACMSNAATMNTGMTRAYRREAIRMLPLEENEKEFHLEVVLKAQAFNYRIHEIPAILEWKEYKHKGQRVQRKSSSKINKLIITHSLFSLFANPIRHVWGLSGLSLMFGLGFLIAGIIRFAMGLVSVYMLIISLTFGIISLLLFAFGLLAQQGNMIQRELWSLKQELAGTRSAERGDTEPPARAKRTASRSN
jgi:glycosyltransferase involved in cell wall biosynthesis